MQHKVNENSTFTIIHNYTTTRLKFFFTIQKYQGLQFKLAWDTPADTHRMMWPTTYTPNFICVKLHLYRGYTVIVNQASMVQARYGMVQSGSINV